MSIDQIAWVGPRPLRETDALIGRSREVRELVDRCRTYDVILVTAPSGVGKTSFVQAGGRVALERATYRLPTPIAWRELLDDPAVHARRGQPVAEQATALYLALVGAPLVEPGARLPDPVEVLDTLAGERRMAVILDQVEELLRFNPALGRELLRIAGETARDGRVPHVIVARAEYQHQLAPAEVRGAKVWPLYLNEIQSPKALAEIVTVPAAAAGVDIAEDSVEQIMTWWYGARRDATRDREQGSELFGGVGLLHLQALLWSLRAWAVDAGLTTRIDASHLREFASARGQVRHVDDDDDRVGGRLVEDAVIRYVADAIAAAAHAPSVRYADSSERKLEWQNGPRLALARVAEVLSSGGYKVPQSFESLLAVAYSPELTQRGARQFARAVVRNDERFGGKTVTGAGIAAHWPARQVLHEMRDALRSALQAMSVSEVNILREYNITDQPVYELVHDGFGPALAKWSHTFVETPIASIGVIAEQRGEAIWQDLYPEVFVAADGTVAPAWGAVAVTREDGEDVATIDAARWASYYVGPPRGAGRLRLERLVFRDCDFTGAAFVACDLRRVRFERCTFLGAVMIGCAFDGVTFATADDHPGSLDLLTVTDPHPDARVTLLGGSPVNGLFLQGLQGGDWRLDDCQAEHVQVTASRETRVTINGGNFAHLTVSGPVELVRSGDPSFRWCRLPGDADPSG
ncbi:MAG: pentapeptide repeat-containing protein [Patulibacter sp.]|nr:pentapeptide repeat-containing protein [Patulibacter sp.]